MSAKPDGGPAFPIPLSTEMIANLTPDAMQAVSGMSIRDWFAGLAMQGTPPGYFSDIESTASRAYDIADAMIAERNK